MGLDLRFVDGVHSPLEVLAGRRFSIDSIALIATAIGPKDSVVDTLIRSSEFSELEWTGLEFDQERRLETIGSSIRLERYYRGAQWMGGEHRFTVRVKNANGIPLGNPVELRTTSDWPPAVDDAFSTRRFGVVTGTDEVPEDGVLDDLEFYGVAAVQLRNGIRGLRTFLIPEDAAVLELSWNHRPAHVYEVPLAPISEADWDYGLEIVTRVLPPAGGAAVHEPGDSVTVVVDLFDRSGHRLHDEGAWPPYQDYVDGLVASGLQYKTAEPSVVYYLDTNQERTLIASLTGPKGAVVQTHEEVPRIEFTESDTQVVATVTDHGYVSLEKTRPPASEFYGPLGSLALPLSNAFTFELPAVAPPGIYQFSVKVHREYLGEHSIATAVIEIPIGSSPPQFTPIPPLTGNCEHCHQADFALSKMLHYLGETDTCTGCHSPYEHQTDNLLPYRIHRIHALSDRYQEDRRDCTVCHLNPTEEVEDLARWLVCTACHPPQETHEGFHPFGDVQTCADVECHHTLNPKIHILEHDD